MSSHEDPKVNDKFLEWLNEKYGEHMEVKATCGNKHEYLGMTFIFEKRKVKINIVDYIEKMLEEFPVKFKPETTGITPAGVDMFEVDNNKKLDNKERESSFIENQCRHCSYVRDVDWIYYQYYQCCAQE